MPHTVLSHTADTGIEATSPTWSGLLEELANGMFSLMAVIRPCDGESVEVVIEAGTEEDLVVDLLSELLYLSEVRDLLLCSFTAEEAGPTSVRLRATGVAFAVADLQGPPIKAVTYHGLVVEETDTGWRGRVYFDV